MCFIRTAWIQSLLSSALETESQIAQAVPKFTIAEFGLEPLTHYTQLSSFPF